MNVGARADGTDRDRGSFCSMHSVVNQFATRGPVPEWHEFSYLSNARTRGSGTPALFLVLWIALVDVCWPKTNVSILYVAPLLMLAQTTQPRTLWRTAAILTMLTFGGYFLKNLLVPEQAGDDLFGYRLVNRTLVAATMVALVPLVMLWQRGRREAIDAELPDTFRREEQEIGATLAAVCCAPLVGLIAVIDLLSPANYNLAILYPVPLLICAWSRSRTLIWTMLVALELLSFAAFLWGPPLVASDEMSLTRNRVLSGLGMLVVTAILHFWLGSDRDDSPSSLAD
jgi:hypothetical protein